MAHHSDQRSAELRSLYASMLTADLAGVTPRQRERLYAAFNAVPRENYVGPGPWQVLTASGYVETPSSDLAYLYQNVLVALSAKENVNNGEPAAHAKWLAALDVPEGETILHLGAGTGYYTAILAHLTGPCGHVAAYEIDEARAAAAKANLAGIPWVTVEHKSASAGRLPQAGAIYVNAGATRPLDIWLDALKPQGSLLFPLTHGKNSENGQPIPAGGGMLLVRNTGGEVFAARFVTSAAFIGCIGARDEASATELAAAFRTGKLKEVRSLHRSGAPDQSCWYAGKNWWLSTAPPAP